MDTAAVLPHVNAGLNALSTVLLVAGYVFIRAGRRDAHRAAMLGALGVSAAFLVSYLTYHFTAPMFVFPGTGLIRPVYYTILTVHVVLAIAIVPLVILTVLRAWRGVFARHKAIARWTLPLWLCVTVSGVVVYLMLYQLYDRPA
ncbi:DUF420 domain-containing protein [Roseospira goensis]|uniref:Uncharacterized membrane protein YozB (DUF420 family) n=1 Tax=Roseospira goensis TaxID=391922 RepID=A0A7W6S2V7_9PROT|nr:DUF420 domain-containing protein [Roseospira goensis]MBB4287172.1 uncharacterized membrane protein YozB (DUF420 family) [Roseospira goensis]